MKISEWRLLKVVEDLEKLNEGDCFLMGESVSAQKENKKTGDEISYYRLLRKEKSVEYTPIYDILEED